MWLEPPFWQDDPLFHGDPLWQDEDRRPTVVTVMAEHSASPVWDRSPGVSGSWMDPAELGISAPLAARLWAWNEQYERLAITDFAWESPEVEAAWGRQGLHLAYELQDELGADVEVRYHRDGNEVPIRGPSGRRLRCGPPP